MKLLILFIFLFSFIFPACKTHNNKKDPPVIVKLPPVGEASAASENSSKSQFTYDLKNPDNSWKLPKQLVEVSGNTWVDKEHLLLIDDNYSSLYLIKIGDKNAGLETTIPFQKDKNEKLDIEDVAIVNNIVYALSSHGILYKISDWNGKYNTEKITTFLSKKNDTEGLSYDPVTKSLLIACKEESGLEEEKKSTKAVYQFNMDSKKLEQKPFLVIHEDDFEKLTKDKIKFNPSAIAVHPVTHEIYILSTQDNKCMAVYSREGKLISFQSIDKDLMPQPEGICFSPEGKLYISSEGKKGDAGNLFEFNAK